MATQTIVLLTLMPNQRAEYTRNQQQEQFRLDVREVVAETPSAILVRVQIPGSKITEDMWFPLSQVHSIHKDPTAPWIIVTPWIAKKKGFL